MSAFNIETDDLISYNRAEDNDEYSSVDNVEDNLRMNKIFKKLDEHIETYLLKTSTSTSSGSMEIRDKSYESFLKTAESVYELYPNSRWYGLGNKTAWILKAMELLGTHRPKNSESFDQYHYVPFSEPFEEEERHEIGDFTIVLSRENPETDKIHHYETLFQKIGLDPMDVHLQYKLFKKKTVVVCYTDSDQIIVPFIKIFFDMAKAWRVDLEDAFEVVTVSPEDHSTESIKFLFTDDGNSNLTCMNVIEDKYLLRPFVRGQDDDRDYIDLFPNHLAEKWTGLVPILNREISQRNKKIVEKLDELAEKYMVKISTPILTLTSMVEGKEGPFSFEIPSITSGQVYACDNLEYYTNGDYKNLDKSGSFEERRLGIYNEPLYIILSFNTTGKNTLNSDVYFNLMVPYFKDTEADTMEFFVDYIMSEIKNSSSFAYKTLQQACSFQFCKNCTKYVDSLLSSKEHGNENFENLIKLSETVNDLHPNARWYSLGKKSALILKTVEILNAHQPKTNESFYHYHYIPFSESFKEEKRHVVGNFTIVFSRWLPTEKQITHYEGLLREIGLDPKEILYHYQHFKRKTVIVDITAPDRFIVPFTKIMSDWAKNEGVDLKEALEIVTVTSEDNSTQPISFMFTDEELSNVTCTNVNGDKNLMNVINNGIGEDPHFTDIVSSYPAEDWIKPLHETTGYQEERKIYGVLKKDVEEYSLAHANHSTPKLTLSTHSTDGTQPIILNIPSVSSGRNNDACLNREFYTNGQYKKIDKDATYEERYRGITNEPLYLILTYKTSGSNTLNQNIYFELTKSYSLNMMFEQNPMKFEDYIMDSLKKTSLASVILDKACELRHSQYQSKHTNAKFTDKYLNPEQRKTNVFKSVDESSVILRTSPNDTDVLQEIDLQIPDISAVTAIISTCPFQISRIKRDVTQNAKQPNDLFESYRYNPFYLIFTYNTTGEYTLNSYIYKHLWAQYALTSQNNSFMEFIQEEMNDSTSLSGEILNEACNQTHFKDHYNIGAPVKEKEGIFHKIFVSEPMKGFAWLGEKWCQAKLLLKKWGGWHSNNCDGPRHGYDDDL